MAICTVMTACAEASFAPQALAAEFAALSRRAALFLCGARKDVALTLYAGLYALVREGGLV
jgi:hypothetical protein